MAKKTEIVPLSNMRKGPKKSHLLDIDMTKRQKKLILSECKNLFFSTKELMYQYDGLTYKNPTPIELEDVLIGCFILRALRHCIDKKEQPKCSKK